jgi:hypothetical protein
MPCLDQEGFVVSDQRLDAPQLASREAEVSRKPNGAEPELRRDIVTIDVNVRRLVRLMTEEISR